MFEILRAGGWALAPIILCSAIALGIILERFWSLRHNTVLPPGLAAQVLEWSRTRKIDPAHVSELAATSPLGEVLAAALSVRQRPREVIRERVEDAGRHVMHELDRYLNTLGTIALIGPLLGLLGTVFGLIRMFLDVMAGGVGDPAKMAGGIGEALICTAAGMVVAIPAYIFHRYLRARVTTLGVEIEKQAGLLVDELTAAHEVPATALRASR